MRWPVASWVGESDDYRAPGFGQRVAAAAERGVVVCGTSRSGKTTLLNRLREQAAVGGAAEIIDISLGPELCLTRLEATLEAPGSAPRGALLDMAALGGVEVPLDVAGLLDVALRHPVR
jgi:type IV secretory pathway ATPase VirB11/archaellum biosynthesis ATPase